MNDTSINEQYDSIIRLLEQKRLKEAQVQTEALLPAGTYEKLYNRLEQNKTSYAYMLQYMREGLNDPQRQLFYLQLGAELWTIADQAYLSALDKTSTRYYHELRRTRAFMSLPEPTLADKLHTLESISDDMALRRMLPQNGKSSTELLRKHEEKNRLLFLSTWSNSEWTPDDAKEAGAFLQSELLQETDLCLFVSAVTMSLLECFDTAKIKWLMEATQLTNTQAAQRAITGLTLVLLRHGLRVTLYYPQLMHDLETLNDKCQLGKQMNRVCVQLLRSRETEKIDQKMREEIIPEMMKSVDFLKQMKFDNDQTGESDRNPDWASAFEQSELGNKLREMNELQMNGSDIYMSTFSLLKGFPFFNEMSNWFLPFDFEHSAVAESLKEMPDTDKMVKFLLTSGTFCDSDKYSLALTMAQVSKERQGMLLSQFSPQEMKDMVDETQLDDLRQQAARPEAVSNQYIHDLYRFFNLFRRKQEFRNPLKENLNPYHNPALRQLVNNPEQVQYIADFLFQNDYLPEALELYQTQIQWVRQPDTFQRIGFCLQKEKRYREAIKAYQTADEMLPNHTWTIRHLAGCYRALKDYETALSYYRKVASLQPENRDVVFKIGSCLAETERYEEALQHFFRLDLEDEDNPKIVRAIGWCSLLSGRLGQAAKYYARIPEEGRTADDWLNMGHVAWVSGDVPGATDDYRQAACKYESHEAFRQAFEKDRDILVRLGIQEEDIPLMEDQAI